MTEESKIVMRGDKCAKIIQSISNLYHLSLEEATEIFYNSVTCELIEEGVANLNCRSENYLAQCVMDEHFENNPQYQN